MQTHFTFLQQKDSLETSERKPQESMGNYVSHLMWFLCEMCINPKAAGGGVLSMSTNNALTQYRLNQGLSQIYCIFTLYMIFFFNVVLHIYNFKTTKCIK